jgi:hypothetical protein
MPMAFEAEVNNSAADECPYVADADEVVNLSSIAGMWAWNNDQGNKVTINYDGSVQSWTGPGRADAVDLIKRSSINKFISRGVFFLTARIASDSLAAREKTPRDRNPAQ